MPLSSAEQIPLSYTLFFIVLSVVLLACFIWCWVLKNNSVKKNQQLEKKLLTTENEFIKIKEQKHHVEKKNTKNTEQHSAGGSHHELLDLRREISKQKDENKKLKEDLKLKDKDAKEQETREINRLYHLKTENEKLLVNLKEQDLEIKKLKEYQVTSVSAEEFQQKNSECERAKADLFEFKNKYSQVEKQNKSNISKVISLQEKLKIAEQEITKWTKASAVMEGKTVDPDQLVKWKERALQGRKMYKLMRQMRELSDNKVESYQDGVLALAEWVIKTNGGTPPVVKPNENKADRFLSEAWDKLLNLNQPANLPPREEKTEFI